MMRCLTVLLLVSALLGAASVSPSTPEANEASGATRFSRVDLVITTDEPLAAYQLEFHATAGRIRIVGIEGGDPLAYADAPYYDPKAMQGDRAVLAAFSTNKAESLPTGRVRIATVHVMIEGDAEPEYAAKLTAAADPTGAAIDAKLELITH